MSRFALQQLCWHPRTSFPILFWGVGLCVKPKAEVKSRRTCGLLLVTVGGKNLGSKTQINRDFVSHWLRWPLFEDTQ